MRALTSTLPDPDQPLMAAGVTSMLAMQLVSQLEGQLGRTLAPTLVFDWPTAAELAAHLAGTPLQATTSPSARRPTTVRCLWCLVCLYGWCAWSSIANTRKYTYAPPHVLCVVTPYSLPLHVCLITCVSLYLIISTCITTACIHYHH